MHKAKLYFGMLGVSLGILSVHSAVYALGPAGTATDPFTGLNMAHNVPSSGVYYFNIGGTTFNTFVDTSNGGGWIQLAIDNTGTIGTLPGLTALPQTITATGTDNGILNATILAKFTGLSNLRIQTTTSGGGHPTDVINNNAALFARIAANQALSNSNVDNGINGGWTGTKIGGFGADTCNRWAGGALQSLNTNIIDGCGDCQSFNWVPTRVDLIDDSYSSGSTTCGATKTAPASETFRLFAQVAKATVAVKKNSVGGTGTFSFSQTNLLTSIADIATTTSGTSAPVSPTPINVISLGVAVTLTETPVAGYTQSVSCLDSNTTASSNPTTNLVTFSGGVATISATYVKANAVITCTYTNTKTPTLKVGKKSVGGVGTFNYTINGTTN